jgi:NAD(P)-dependent dehydrogenase (short-subunit alcohol dehydrogenase family)
MAASLHDRTLLLAGGTSKVGSIVAHAALERGARVIIVGNDPEALARTATDVPNALLEQCDLTDEASVAALRDRTGPVDGVLHLVGGWRGGGGLAGQSEADFRFLEISLTALRHVSRAYDEALRSSPAGRLAMISSTSVDRPMAGSASYTALKAAAEAWTRAVAQGFAKQAPDAAAVIFRVTTLDGLEPALAEGFLGLWDAEASAVNDTVVNLAS